MCKRDKNNYINKPKELSMVCYDNYTIVRYSKELHTPQQDLVEDRHYLPKMYYFHRSEKWYDGYYVGNHRSQKPVADYASSSEERCQFLEYNSQGN